MSVKAIVVEDDENVLQTFTKLLEHSGVQVIGKAKNGKEGALLYNQTKPDVVFMDIMMPNFDGVYGIKEIKKQDPNAKIVVVTADLQTQTYDEIIKNGVVNILYKPFEFKKIVNCIANLFPNSVN